MHRSLSKRRRVAATFILMLLVATLIALLLPKATAAPSSVKINSIAPTSGPVGTTVRVIGETNTVNGSYQILWDGKNLREGTCEPGTTIVNDTFTVPSSVEGYHNVTLYDTKNGTESLPVLFKVTISYHVSAEPARIQEGLNTTITVRVNGAEANKTYALTINVTDPHLTPAVYTSNVTVSTNATGSGSNSTLYYGDFSSGAHTNYVGTYTIAVMAINETLATGNFTVGLTNATEYHRFQVVSIQAANYTQPNEYAWVNITFAGKIVFSENVSADGGMIKTNWTIPGNASMGLYTVTVTSSIANGTVKPVLDAQNFTIAKIPCQIQTRKLNGEALADVVVWVYNATMEAVNSSLTNEEGLVKFWLEGGNYTFEAEWGEPGRRIPVGTLVNESIKLEAGEKIVNVTLWCWIAHLRIAISPPLPFINITITYQNKTISSETNSTGIWEIPRDMPTNVSYTIEARRYGLSFYNKTLEKLPAAMNLSWVNITINCPTYTMFVHVLDSKESPLRNVHVKVYEWSSGVAEHVQSGTTNEWGSVTLRCTFGKYKIWVYNQNHTIVLNKTVVDLIEDRLFFVVHCKIFNVDLSVVVKDHFGNPIPNALVKVERENVDMPPQKTGSNGKTSFENIIGGEVRISVSVNGKLCETRTIYLDETEVVAFKLDRYVMVAGYPLETTQFIACISLGMLVALLALALIYRRLRARKVSEVKEKSL